MQILSYFDVFQNEVFGIDLNLAASLNNINEKVNRLDFLSYKLKIL